MTTIFSSLNNWISESISSETQVSVLSGYTYEQFGLSLVERLKSQGFSEDIIVVTPSVEIAENLYNVVKPGKQVVDIFLITSDLKNLYREIGSNSTEHNDTMRYLTYLSHRKKKGHICILCTESFIRSYPPLEFISENSITIEVGSEIDPFELSEYLVEIGYSPMFDCADYGTFSRKGLVFDINPMNCDPVRLIFEDDRIQKIHPLNLNNQKSDTEIDINKVILGPGNAAFFNESRNQLFKESLQKPTNLQKEKFLKRKDIFSHINNTTPFPDFEKYINLFFKRTLTLTEIVKPDFVVKIDESKTNILADTLIETLNDEYNETLTEKDNTCLLPEPARFISKPNINVPQFFVNEALPAKDVCSLESNLVPSKLIIDQFTESNDQPLVKKRISSVKKIIQSGIDVYYASENQQSKDEIKFLLEKDDIKFLSSSVSEGFYNKDQKLMVLSEGDIFNKKTKKAKRKQHRNDDIDLFAEQISTLEEGDFIVHKELGLAKYLGTKPMKTGEHENDFLLLEFDKGDKVYLPSYKINLIQKHSGKDSKTKVTNIRNNNFENTKKRIQERIKTLAFDLLKLNAKRKMSTAFTFKQHEHEEIEFGLTFPYEETPDQMQAIKSVFKNMEKNTPMDHLVCGDVGFGKTEVAIRAAHKAVLDKKQVAVLVPTTILALQHFNSFQKRFKEQPINVELVSRFRTAKEIKEIIQRVELGLVDVIIGTHKLLSKSLKFKDLGLFIVDEEQRFGVAHKEKFKTYKENIDCLTLSATPIPRTMQMAFLGLKEFSVIKTPPPRRQSIKTYLMKDDDFVIKEAIEYELSRGGQVYIVHNRVRDIEDVYNRITELVPSAKVTYAHGQMKEKELEDRILKFFKGSYNILIATTIIESGIDIPNANTLIVNNADRFGLSQLHQLRGRIGRSDKKAFSYLMVKDLHNLSTVASKRLKALKNFSEVGSGFSIASVDLELRGAGDILGAEQSGHMEEIGLELYMQLLDQAIKELEGEKQVIDKNVELITDFASKIPNGYIENSSERLKYYKLLSNSNTFEGIESLREELINRFGKLPAEVENLISVLKSRLQLSGLGITTIKKSANSLNITFEKNFLTKNQNALNKIIKLVSERPRYFQLNAKGELFCQSKKDLDNNNYLEFVSYIAENIKT